ncbi:hypothetical protein ACTXT7_017176, partial [Hymenolepis weldensis]
SGVTVLPSQSLLQQQQHQRQNFIRQLSTTAPISTPLSPPPAASLEALPRELPGESEVAGGQEESGSSAVADDFLSNIDASAEAAAAVANLEAESSMGGFEVDDADMYLNHHNSSPQQQVQQAQAAQFSRSGATTAATSGNVLREELADIPEEKGVKFCLRRLGTAEDRKLKHCLCLKELDGLKFEETVSIFCKLFGGNHQNFGSAPNV